MINPPLISLCLIAGNEEIHIERCLESFKAVADEIIVVIAIGNQVPDKTEEIALKFGAKIFHYENGDKSLPHLDNFGKARNMSFNKASGNYLMWCDCDDILAPQNVPKIRELAEKGEHDCYHFTYKIPGSGKEPLRERLIRRGKGAWILAIHEHMLLVEGATHKIRDDIFILHSPLESKRKSFDRNINILKKSSEFGSIYNFYLHQEHYGLGEKEKAIEYGKIAQSYNDLPVVERYEVRLHMAELEPEKKEEWLLNAFRMSPWRREALVELCRLQVAKGNVLNALSYALMYDSLPEPDIRPWTHAGAWYTWAGDLLLAQCYRLCGNEKRGNEVEQELFTRSRGLITLCHATRGRAKQCMDAKNMWLTKAYYPQGIEHIFAIDSDDKEVLDYTRGHRRIIVDPKGCNHAFNEAAKMASGKILMVISDDAEPAWYWDNQVVQKLKDHLDLPAVLATSDGHRKDRLIAFPILTKKRFEDQGNTIFGPYPAVFADTEFTHRAYKDKIVIEARDIVITHNHPVFTTGNLCADETYAKQNSQQAYIEGEKIFRERNPEATLDTVAA